MSGYIEKARHVLEREVADLREALAQEKYFREEDALRLETQVVDLKAEAEGLRKWVDGLEETESKLREKLADANEKVLQANLRLARLTEIADDLAEHHRRCTKRWDPHMACVVLVAYDAFRATED